MPKPARSSTIVLVLTLLALLLSLQARSAVTTDAASTIDNNARPSVVARQATPEEVGYQVIASPMLLEVSLGAHGQRKSLKEMDDQHVWTNTETAAFVCEKARVKMVQAWKVKKRDQITLRVMPMFAAEHTGRSIDVTVAIASGEKEVRKGLLRVETAGIDSATASAIVVVRVPHAPVSLAFAPVPQATTKNTTAEFDFEFTEQEFAAMFDDGRAPILRMILDIQ
ncbi:MAG TPA: hypothetical protein VHG32_11510 [Thermoanaerobaculia bacterium]|jgi:hypothetical protein|nr:hypothetical protein [Thermoanaerobaculia bacterium]